VVTLSQSRSAAGDGATGSPNCNCGRKFAVHTGRSVLSVCAGVCVCTVYMRGKGKRARGDKKETTRKKETRTHTHTHNTHTHTHAHLGWDGLTSADDAMGSPSFNRGRKFSVHAGTSLCMCVPVCTCVLCVCGVCECSEGKERESRTAGNGGKESCACVCMWCVCASLCWSVSATLVNPDSMLA
jgi:hypothetical protein